MAGPRRGPGRIPEKPKNFKGTIGQLFRYLGRYRLGLALVLVPRLELRGMWIAMAIELCVRGLLMLFRQLTTKYYEKYKKEPV